MSEFIPLARIERLAAEALRAYHEKTGRAITPPIDVDLVGEVLYELRWEYDLLGDPATLAALFPRRRLVRLNELHAGRFAAKPGLERFTKAHEVGHWVLHARPDTLDHPTLDATVATTGDTVFCRDGTRDQTEIQADLYAGALLMPEGLITASVKEAGPLSWPAIYDLARAYDVTVSAMRVRLEQLGLIHVDDEGRIYRSRAERFGQQSLF